MGKGDKKSKKGKISSGSYGVSRKRKKNTPYVAKVKKVAPKKEEAPVAEEVEKKSPAKKSAAKKPAAKKTPAKKKPAAKK